MVQDFVIFPSYPQILNQVFMNKLVKGVNQLKIQAEVHDFVFFPS
jgi:hypothetical protein